MCQLFQMLDRAEDWLRKKGALFCHGEHLGSMIFEPTIAEVNLRSTVFIKESLLKLLSTLILLVAPQCLSS